MVKRMILLIALLFIMIGCVSEKDCSDIQEWNTDIKTTYVNYAYFSRVIDIEASTVCYLYSTNAIDCMPLSETSLDY